MLQFQSLGLFLVFVFALESAVRSESPIPDRAPAELVAETVRSSLQEQYSLLWQGMSADARAGYRNLVRNAYLPADFDESVLEKLDKERLPIHLKDSHEENAPRSNTWKAFGLSPRPDEPSLPLQYVVSPKQEYVMNCFACHGGNLFGATYPGAPNTTYALESLTEQVRKAKLALGKPLTHMDIGSVFMPLGTTVGSSNAVMFGVALMHYRDAHLNVYPGREPAEMMHHDMDAPPWWHFHRKRHIYIDGFAQKGHRGLMQFMLVRQNGPEQFKQWEKEFEQVFAFISELRAPKYPLAIDRSKAQRGLEVFSQSCAQCHGTYSDENRHYPEVRVELEDIGTDPIRHQALSAKHRDSYGQSWFAHFGGQETVSNPSGYVAPPLDGIWASAPYLHNGSVPTLWHLLHPEQRPEKWRRITLGIDPEKVGFGIEVVDELPPRLKPAERRWYFDATQFGKSNQGHNYPNILSEQERSDLLEYLKTL
jgi:mono/diheme cytochrome c family protein